MPAGTGKTRDCRLVFSAFPSWPHGCCLRTPLISGVDIGSRLSLAFECSGLILLCLAPVPAAAQAGAALAGFGFSLVFPALGVEAVRNVPTHDRGTALGVYTAFVDLSLAISGPMAGTIVFTLGYPPIFLFAAAMAGSSMAILIMLYRKRAVVNNIAPRRSRLRPDQRSNASRIGRAGLKDGSQGSSPTSSSTA